MGQIKLKKYLKDNLYHLYQAGLNQPKHAIKDAHNASPFIHSNNTFRTYVAQCNRFTAWCYDRGVKLPEPAKELVPEYIKFMQNEGRSAWTIYTAISAISKAYGMRTTDWGIQPPKRERNAVKRSRYATERDKHVSLDENKNLITFCKCTGLRRREVEEIHGTNYRLNSNGTMFVYVSNGKGGKTRWSEVYGTPQEIAQVRQLMDRAGEGKVFQHVHTKLDIHSLRGLYACNLYKKYERDTDKLPFNEKYICRKDRAGVVYDRKTMEIVSRNLGHNRVCVIAESYLYNL